MHLTKYIEIGIGNTWLVRTEFEIENGDEYEEKGIKGPINFHSAYIRVWFWKSVIIIDSREGLKTMQKNKGNFKFIFGIVSKERGLSK
ncbi:DUF3977 family protein [Bacillus sp. ISL-37]|jgi:hypothetical protein|uniref:DUF3977 family protein n=1 Tax=Bacillus sp. ISL-37 TaxID=2819123 RepID=UPI001BE810B8|nr:DUF3977 family protein [Bacillus sp. ISL-37]MBT2682810.1 DUF3977 family protein [Bacillus sp. ISL-37]